jgi:pyridoxine 5-phosphate synthase
MTKLSVNLNKIALLRNSRGRDFPNVFTFAAKFIERGVHGITVHPREDERHITVDDSIKLGEMLADMPNIEFNIEGYPSEEFLSLVEKIKPEQCTLVPDSPDQLTSDHGWGLTEDAEFAKASCARLARAGIRSALFLDPDVAHVELAAKTGVDRIELYTELYAATHKTPKSEAVLTQYKAAATRAQELGLGVNAGHDLDLQNLPGFLGLKDILEVSIGHVLTVECIEQGMDTVVKQYLEICNNSA